MKFFVPNYSCLQNPWLLGYRPQIPVLSVLNWICWIPPPALNKIPGYAIAGNSDLLLDELLTMNRTVSAVCWRFFWSWGCHCQHFNIACQAFRWPSCTLPRLLLRKVLTAWRTDIGICKTQIICPPFESKSGQCWWCSASYSLHCYEPWVAFSMANINRKLLIQSDTKKTGTFEKPNKNWRNPRKKIYWQKLNHYNLPFKRQ